MKGLGMWVLAAGGLLAACGGTAAAGRGASGRYAQEFDTATSTCSRNPACYTQAPGERAILPWLSRAADTARAAATVARMLDAAELARVEQLVEECAKDAEFEVNERELGGRRTTRELCQEEVGRDSRGQPVTRAMALGTLKHAVALQCVREKLGELMPENFSIEPRYHYDVSKSVTRLLDPKQVEAWLRDGLVALLVGTLVPDVVIHASGNPLKVQVVYEMKFPCPSTNPGKWRDYPLDHPHQQPNQKALYEIALGGKAKLMTPRYGASQ